MSQMSQQQAANIMNEIEQEVTLCSNSLEEFYARLAGNYGSWGTLQSQAALERSKSTKTPKIKLPHSSRGESSHLHSTYTGSGDKFKR
jgi:hypothetical protein